MNFYEQAQMLFPWLPAPLLRVYADAWAQTGDSSLAWATMQESDVYDTYFAGNRRDDGTLRYSEYEYMTALDSYRNIFESIGLNPQLFEDQFVTWIAGDLSPDEVWQERVQPMVERVLDTAPQIKQYYADTYGIELTDQAILASILNPDLDQRIINKQISISEIGGLAAAHHFVLDSKFAESMVQQGVTADQASQLFGQAGEQVPILNVLMQRHNDPNDTFDIYDFTNAAVWQDPTLRQRMKRLYSQEASLFKEGVGMGQLAAADESKRQIGLMVR